MDLQFKTQTQDQPVMSTLFIPDRTMITITDKARNHLAKMLKGSDIKSGDLGIRIGVKAGGCHGLQYIVLVVTQREKHDLVMMLLGVKVFIDPKSMAVMLGTEIDCSDNLLDPLVFKNPRAKSTCGCGTSFELKEKPK